MGKRDMSIEKSSTHQPRRRERPRPALQRAVRTWVQGAGVFALLFTVTTSYIVLRGGHDVQAVVESLGAGNQTWSAEAQPSSIPAMALGIRDSQGKGGDHE